MDEVRFWKDRIYTENIIEEGYFLGRIEVTKRTAKAAPSTDVCSVSGGE